MSISGATAGLVDLIKEYNESIGDEEVTDADHKDIAKEMDEWVTKIKEYSSYMSDVITAVKGQTTNLNSNQSNTFTIDELVKRVDILMKHEMQNALITLNVKVTVDKNIIIQGDVNSMVQVINNMLSNSIQSYNGEPNKTIDAIIDKKEEDLIITIRDYGCGMSEKIQEKLFKEMITTKGKNGTGLGLFMSYSTIRGNFNGSITFESEENIGTNFYITIPLSNLELEDNEEIEEEEN